METPQLTQYIQDHAQRDHRGEPGYGYAEMMVYNDLTTPPVAKPALESAIAVYDKLYGFGLSLSGYQFIGLILEKSAVENTTHIAYPFAYFMLAVGFVVSLFGALLSFCMYEFLVFARTETDEYIVKGVVYYRKYLRLPHDVLLANTFLFALPINILIHNHLELVYGIIFNVVSLTLLAVGFPIHRRMVSQVQTYAKTRIGQLDV